MGYASGGVVVVNGDGLADGDDSGVADQSQLWKGDIASTTRDSGRGCTVGGGLVRGIDGSIGHASVGVVEWAIAKLAVPVMVEDVFGVKLVMEAEDAEGVGFSGVKVVFGAFEGSKLFNRKVFREAFDSEAGKIVGHSIQLWSVGRPSFKHWIFVAD